VERRGGRGRSLGDRRLADLDSSTTGALRACIVGIQPGRALRGDARRGKQTGQAGGFRRAGDGNLGVYGQEAGTDGLKVGRSSSAKGGVGGFHVDLSAARAELSFG